MNTRHWAFINRLITKELDERKQWLAKALAENFTEEELKDYRDDVSFAEDVLLQFPKAS